MRRKIAVDKPSMFLGASPKLFINAQKLRLRETTPEQLLWSRLLGKQLGVKFRRQHPIYAYIADFYCHSHKLVIEVDGPIRYTKENRQYDNERTQVLNEFKIDVIRFANEQVLSDIEFVLKEIQDRLAARVPCL